MATLHYTVTITAPVAKVRDKMLNHPGYEERTAAFATGSTYQGSRNQGEQISFTSTEHGGGMVAQIAENRTHEFVSIQHLKERSIDPETGERKENTFPTSSYENYTFTQTQDGTQIDVSLDPVPDERAEYMNEARPKALQLLKEICEK